MLTAGGALLLLVPALPIAVWATLSDFKRLKIPNRAVFALAALWPLLGWLAVPTWTAWFWGLAILVIGFVVAYLAFALLHFPGGDGKYAAAIAPMFVGADPLYVLKVVLVAMVAATILHLLLRKLSFIHRLTPDWQGWTNWRRVPFAPALSGMMIFNLLAAIWS